MHYYDVLFTFVCTLVSSLSLQTPVVQVSMFVRHVMVFVYMCRRDDCMSQCFLVALRVLRGLGRRLGTLGGSFGGNLVTLVASRVHIREEQENR